MFCGGSGSDGGGGGGVGGVAGSSGIAVSFRLTVCQTLRTNMRDEGQRYKHKCNDDRSIRAVQVGRALEVGVGVAISGFRVRLPEECFKPRLSPGWPVFSLPEIRPHAVFVLLDLRWERHTLVHVPVVTQDQEDDGHDKRN